VGEGAAAQEEEGAEDQERCQIEPLALVEARRDEAPELVEDERGREEQGRQRRHLEIEEEGVGETGEDQLLVRTDLLDGELQEGEDRPHPVPARGERHGQADDRPEEALPQLLEVLQERHAGQLLLGGRAPLDRDRGHGRGESLGSGRRIVRDRGLRVRRVRGVLGAVGSLCLGDEGLGGERRRHHRRRRSRGAVGEPRSTQGVQLLIGPVGPDRRLGLLVQGQLDVDRPLEVVGGLAELRHAAAEGASDLGQPLGAEDQQRQHQDEDQLGNAQTKHAGHLRRRSSSQPEALSREGPSPPGPLSHPHSRPPGRGGTWPEGCYNLPMRRSWRITAITLFTLSLVLGGLFGDRLLAIGNDTRDSLRLYTELVNVAHERYGAEVSYRDLVYSSVNGMLRSLDPHTSFLSPEAYEGMREKQQTSFYGLGILVGVRNGQLTVISPLEGSPASRMGIQAGDVISTIEGEPTDAMTIDEAIQKLKGPKGTQVKITIVRRGLPEAIAMSVTRAEIPQTTVRQAYMVTPTTGYILLTEFSRGTGREMADAIAKLKAQGMKQLLVDLRNNGGGLLDQAIEVADQFLPEDSTIVETRGRTRDSFQSYQASGKYPALGVPVVVRVNEGTASAAEILSGAIQDHDRGLVVGAPSWGKGLVQTVYNLSYGAGLALTTAKYYTPSGRLIQRDYSSYFDYYTHADAGSPEVTGKAVDPSQIFETDLGRKVYGGGGITPDVLVQEDELLPFEQF